ncbi:helix-turn-helix domain-containing protein [Schinkia azotoformans]|uniref:helix-turn-helix domain-containing protein n=1 Tax=Schinkia azotoformans TaxID=1454 RepID=UPI002DBBE8D9|nr:helix-turn-helix domain-containing protein [Schinkia azotoformans]MEC1717875.1 helix-turn-helix domain-containing protein [Schinkia azotoformans]MEC1739724.1 helix-turn-helix domain-containing protein [Schinkia azotoformans]MEC1757966.1 helix-turn-helix domain-containing protein [Schinkia azotoformans]MEC1767259.1 helix-turn-helix domain-containing protein [Schinkia azotoformans]MEC1789195.1 helix-turn-helix domain-containing protein [Schinkia azotoformans]
MEFIQEAIAKNLAKIRKKRGLSLDNVSELTGVSKAMLAQIENGKSNPTVTTLWKIANGLQVSFSGFLKENDKPEIEKINMNELNPIIDDDENYLVYSIFPFHPEKKFEIFTVDLKPGFSHISEKHTGEEYVLIQCGTLTLNIQGEKFELNPDETIKFNANTEHIYINPSDEMVRFYTIIYYPD